jgi:hypothetical protein
MEMPKIKSLEEVVIETRDTVWEHPFKDIEDKTEEKSRVVIGDYKGEWYPCIHEGNMIIVDGKLAYVAEPVLCPWGEQTVVFGGKEGPRYNRIGFSHLAPIHTFLEEINGKLAYPAITLKDRGSKVLSNFDGKEIFKPWHEFLDDYGYAWTGNQWTGYECIEKEKLVEQTE